MTTTEKAALVFILWCIVGYLTIDEAGKFIPIIMALIAQAVFIFAGRKGANDETV